MDTASKILIVAGMANLMVGALSGIPMGLMRQGGAEVVPKYLTMVHLGALMNGPILISVAFALTTSTLSPWIDTTAAGLLALASAILLALPRPQAGAGIRPNGGRWARPSHGLRAERTLTVHP